MSSVRVRVRGGCRVADVLEAGLVRYPPLIPAFTRAEMHRASRSPSPAVGATLTTACMSAVLMSSHRRWTMTGAFRPCYMRVGRPPGTGLVLFCVGIGTCARGSGTASPTLTDLRAALRWRERSTILDVNHSVDLPPTCLVVITEVTELPTPAAHLRLDPYRAVRIGTAVSVARDGTLWRCAVIAYANWGSVWSCRGECGRWTVLFAWVW